jgi:general secretion pathway protein D
VDKYHVRYLKNAQATEIVESLKIVLNDMRISDSINMSESAQISAEEGTNALIIVAGPQEYEVISGIIDKLDIFREQVLVEMKIIEVSEDALKEIGFDWATIDEAVTDSLRYFGGTNLGPRVEFQSGDLEGLAIGGWKHNGQSVQIAAIMKALEKNTGVNILSLPHIVTTNHKPAKVVVGENRPFVKDARITETTDFLTPTVIKNYEYRDVGITLEITPHINQNGLVTLVIQSEFTKLIEDVTTLSADTPVTAKRQVQTEVIMESDSTVVIGGLLRDDKVTTKKAVPIVSEIPIFGELFKSSKERVEKTNLLMLITPHIMTTQADLDDMAEKKQKEISLEN